MPEPNNLLSRESVAGVLADLHLLEAVVQAKAYSTDSSKAVLAAYNKFIFEKHGVDSEQFARSFDYYLSNSLQMDTIMGFVIEELSKQEALSRGKLKESLEVMPIPADAASPIK